MMTLNLGGGVGVVVPVVVVLEVVLVAVVVVGVVGVVEGVLEWKYRVGSRLVGSVWVDEGSKQRNGSAAEEGRTLVLWVDICSVAVNSTFESRNVTRPRAWKTHAARTRKAMVTEKNK